MANKNNSPQVWDKLLNNKEYLSDYGSITQKRIKYASDWVGEHHEILNIGSGQGYLELLCSDQISKGLMNWTSLDISRFGLKRIKKLFPRVNCIEGSILSLPFSDKTFEVVICMEVIEHLVKNLSENAYSEMLRVGTDDAIYVISVPVYEHATLVNHPVGHNRKYTPEIIRKELCKNGYKTISEKYLYAFNSFCLIKELVCKFIDIRRPNVVMFLCQKS